MAERDFIEDISADSEVAGKPDAGPRRQRWTDEVVEVLSYEETPQPKRAKRRRRRDPEPTTLLSPNDTAHLQMALTGVMAAHNLHETAQVELHRTRGSLRFAWATACGLAIIAVAVAVWNVSAIADRERRSGVAESQAQMLSDQLAAARAELDKISRRADRENVRAEDTRLKVTALEGDVERLTTSLADAKNQLSDTLARLNDQQNLASTISTQLAETQTARDGLQAERDELAARLQALSRELVETKRELARLRLEYGIDDTVPQDWPEDGTGMVLPNSNPSMGVRTWRKH